MNTPKPPFTSKNLCPVAEYTKRLNEVSDLLAILQDYTANGAYVDCKPCTPEALALEDAMRRFSQLKARQDFNLVGQSNATDVATCKPVDRDALVAKAHRLVTTPLQLTLTITNRRLMMTQATFTPVRSARQQREAVRRYAAVLTATVANKPQAEWTPADRVANFAGNALRQELEFASESGTEIAAHLQQVVDINDREDLTWESSPTVDCRDHYVRAIDEALGVA